jgi:hypothetical protein
MMLANVVSFWKDWAGASERRGARLVVTKARGRDVIFTYPKVPVGPYF